MVVAINKNYYLFETNDRCKTMIKNLVTFTVDECRYKLIVQNVKPSEIYYSFIIKLFIVTYLKLFPIKNLAKLIDK